MKSLDVHLRLSERDAEWLQRVAALERLTKSQLARELLDLGLRHRFGMQLESINPPGRPRKTR